MKALVFDGNLRLHQKQIPKPGEGEALIKVRMAGICHTDFVEPLASACKILEQVHIEPSHRVAVVGDGKLGQLIVRVLHLTGCHLTV